MKPRKPAQTPARNPQVQAVTITGKNIRAPAAGPATKPSSQKPTAQLSQANRLSARRKSLLPTLW